MLDLGSLLNLAMSGITFGMILFLLAAGFELMFGVMRIINMAHGSFFMLGAYVGISIARQTHNFLFGVLMGAISVGMVGLVTERFLFRRLPQHLQQVYVTFGIIYILADVSKMLWGSNPYVLSTPAFLAGSVNILARPFPIYRIVLLGIGLLTALGLWLFQEKTRVGSIVRAGVDDREMVGVIGINIKLLSTLVFTGGALLAGFAGVMASPIIPVLPGIDWDVMTLAMVVVVVGGLGSLRGALVGGLLIGLADTFGKFLLPQVGIVLIFLVLAVVLILRPSGIFGGS
jgi:branched-chain amino acid transport system permease protein